MARLRFTPYNHHDFATLSVTDTSSGFTITNTQNFNRSKVWLAGSVGTKVIRGTLAASAFANAFYMFRHNAHAGDVQIELFTDAAWVTSAYDSTALPADNTTPDSTYEWGLSTVDPFLADSPYWHYFTGVDFQSYEITLSGVSALYRVSRIFLGEYFEVLVNPQFGSSIGFNTVGGVSDRNRGRGGSLRTNIAEMWKVMNLDFDIIYDGDRAVWMDILRYCGMSRDFAVSVFPEFGTREERDNTVNGVFSSLDPLGRQYSYLTKKVQVEEV